MKVIKMNVVGAPASPSRFVVEVCGALGCHTAVDQLLSDDDAAELSAFFQDYPTTTIDDIRVLRCKLGAAEMERAAVYRALRLQQERNDALQAELDVVKGKIARAKELEASAMEVSRSLQARIRELEGS